ncbi:MAG: hypothetical protein RR334_01930 [Clostridia bacterium]
MESFNEYIGKNQEYVVKMLSLQGYEVEVREACSDKTKKTDTKLVTRITSISDKLLLIIVGEFFIGV